MVKINMNVLYNNGKERNYSLDHKLEEGSFSDEDVKDGIAYLQDNFIRPAYKEGINGCISIESGGESISINIKQTSEIKFKLIED